MLGHTRDVDAIRPVVVVRAVARDGTARDVLGSEPVEARVWARPPLVGALAVLVPLAGVLAAVVVQGRPPAVAPAVTPVVTVLGASSLSGPAGGARGELVVEVRNTGRAPVRIGALRLAAPGLVPGATTPDVEVPLAAGQAREHVLAFEVPRCGSLRLPARLLVTSPGGSGRAVTTAVVLGPGRQDGRFEPCPPGTTLHSRPSLAVRGFGGTTTRTAAGARGVLRLDVRNGGAPLQLLRVFAELPGVRFAVVGPANGKTLVTDERTEVRLAFEVADCALLGRTGRVLLQVRAEDREQEVAVPVDDSGRAAEQNALDRVVQACEG